MKILVFTGSRSDFGILRPLIQKIYVHPDLELRLMASGSHLSPEFDNTISEIEAEGYSVDERIEILLSSDSAVGIVKSMGVGLISFSDAIQRIAPDIFVVLGDRFEAHAATTAAMILGVPIAHIHGGEITMGAYDDMLRHSITKMSNLHFVANKVYANRVIQLGEHPSTVFNVGAMGLDGLDGVNDLTEKELSQKLNFDIGAKYFVVTYHPVTNGDESPLETIKNILKSLEKFPNHKVVITLPNADNGSREIIYFIEEYVSQNSNKVIATHSLGHNLFISLLRRASAFVGNSSSGIIEAPSLRIPTVNVGVRQAGRLAANSVISCSGNFDDIFSAVKLALSPSFQVIIRSCINPYGSGRVAEKIIDVLIKIKFARPKKFYDL